MGQDCCCSRNNSSILKKISDNELKNKISNLKIYRNQNFSFFLIYGGVAIASVIVVATGGSSTLILSGILTVSGAIYYIYEVCNQNEDINKINEELKRREDAEVSVVNVSDLPIPIS